jgi:hypothetical protein
MVIEQLGEFDEQGMKVIQALAATMIRSLPDDQDRLCYDLDESDNGVAVSYQLTSEVEPVFLTDDVLVKAKQLLVYIQSKDIQFGSRTMEVFFDYESDGWKFELVHRGDT